MNTLSIILYVAGVAKGVSGLLFFGSLLVGIITILYALASDDNQDVRYGRKPRMTTPGLMIKTISCTLAAMLLAVLVPSRDTVLMIAASELGEEAVTSEYGQEVIEQLKAVVEYQLEELAE